MQSSNLTTVRAPTLVGGEVPKHGARSAVRCEVYRARKVVSLPMDTEQIFANQHATDATTQYSQQLP